MLFGNRVSRVCARGLLKRCASSRPVFGPSRYRDGLDCSSYSRRFQPWHKGRQQIASDQPTGS
nr:MAG TPA: hypothetical protein [Caudoviricetes sp.]